jgi:hypothetical protein
LHRIIATGTGFVATSNESYALNIRSNDGVNWEPLIEEELLSSWGIKAIAAGPSGKVLLSDEAEEGRLLQSETDWNRWSVILPQKVPVDSMVATGNGVFVAFNEEGAWTSADGATWQSAYLMPEASSLGVVEYAGGRFVAGGSAAIILTSTNGAVWAPAAVALESGLGRDSISVSAIAFGNNRYVALGEGWVSSNGWAPVILTSSDGSSWVGRVFSEMRGYQCCVAFFFANGQFYIMSSSPVLTSPDGTTWTSHTLVGLGEAFPRQVVFVNGKFIARLSSDSIATSTDGITWTTGSRVCGDRWTTPRLFAAANTVVATCDTDVFVSNDGTSWSPVTGLQGRRIRSLVAHSNRWVAITEGGSILTYSAN